MVNTRERLRAHSISGAAENLPLFTETTELKCVKLIYLLASGRLARWFRVNSYHKPHHMVLPQDVSSSGAHELR